MMKKSGSIIEAAAGAVIFWYCVFTIMYRRVTRHMQYHY